MAGSTEERQAIAESYRRIRELLAEVLTIDAASLLNGIRAACRRPELRDQFVINALASVHLDVSRALKEFREQSGGQQKYGTENGTSLNPTNSISPFHVVAAIADAFERS